MFCVECGKECQIFRNGVCIDCYLKTHTFTKGPEIIDLPICVHCDSSKIKNTWSNEILSDVIQKLIKNKFQISNELEEVDITTDFKEEKGGLSGKVYISGIIEGQKITEEHELLIRIKKTVCDVCSKKVGGYYESILQIRADRKLSSKELEDITVEVDSFVANQESKGNRTLFITDYGQEHGGLDFYLSEKNAGLIIAKHIQELYGGIIKQSAKNVGMKDSKQVYRVTYLIRLPSYKKGDFIEIAKSIYFIKSTYGNRVKTIDLKSWDEVIFESKDLEKIRLLGGEELTKEAIIVSQTKDEVQIMDPKSYDIKILRKPKKIHFEKEKVKIVKIDDHLFIHPQN